MSTEYKITFSKTWRHFKTIVKHKHYVFYYCRKFGIPWQGIVHDLSKFSPTEFWNNVRYTEPGISPVNIAKQVDGYSEAWMHHKGRNKHHYVYWVDRIDDGCYITRMPYKYLLEYLCDSLGACRAYGIGDKYSVFKKEVEWWNKCRDNLHPDDRCFLNYAFTELKTISELNDYKNNHDKMYKRCKKEFRDFHDYILKYNNNPRQMKIKQPE